MKGKRGWKSFLWPPCFASEPSKRCLAVHIKMSHLLLHIFHELESMSLLIHYRALAATMVKKLPGTCKTLAFMVPVLRFTCSQQTLGSLGYNHDWLQKYSSCLENEDNPWLSFCQEFL